MVVLLDEILFPVIDFSDFGTHPEQTAKELFDAASRWGFLILKGHGIPQQDIDHMFGLVSYPLQFSAVLQMRL